MWAGVEPEASIGTEAIVGISLLTGMETKE